MTAISPDTNIKILRNVPLDDTYDHTIFFPKDSLGETAQYNYFAGKAKYSLTNQTYQRVKRGWIRVGIEADNLYDCNYLMFQNHAYGSKWFYAFIKSVEFINNETSEIEFEIDVMQTWHFSYTLDKCWVEREHSAEGYTDSLYTSENLEPGTYVYSDKTTFDMNDMNIGIIYSPQTVHGKLINHTYFGAGYTGYYSIDDQLIANIDTFINTLISGNQSIIAMYQFPSRFYNSAGNIVTEQLTINQPTLIDGYTPRNRKLYFYPYSFIRVSAQNGTYQDYLYEYFSSLYTFYISGVVAPEPNVVVYPKNYKGLSECFDEKMIISDFPVCAWNEDSFKQWWANNRSGIFYDGISKAISTVTGGVGGQLNASKASKPKTAGGVAGALTVLNMYSQAADFGASLYADVQTAINAPNNTRGNTSSGNINAALYKQAIQFYRMTIKAQRARIIDDYFDRFGYSCQRNKVPNRNVRPHWCYTKTQGCTITGSVPADHASVICQIYDHGLTFWKSGNEVGNYNLDNTINER